MRKYVTTLKSRSYFSPVAAVVVVMSDVARV